MTDNQISLEGQVAIVTGAASGIGRAAVQRFAQAGASVLATDISEAVNETVEMVRAEGGTAHAMIMDAGSETDVAAAVEKAVSLFGGLDIFFANAGITGGPVEFMDADEKLWADVLRVNLIGPFLAVKYAAPKMKERGGGAIVATASVAGLRAGAGPAAYSASKAGVINLVQTAAQELAGTGIRVNAICPGLIETGMTKLAYEFARKMGREDRLGHLNPMKRGGEPQEIADTALFLVSSMSSYINGQAITVDGGLSSSHPSTPKEQREAMRRAMADLAARAS